MESDLTSTETEIDCSFVNSLNSSALQCNFLNETQNCKEKIIINYLELFYCTIGAYDSKVLPLIIGGIFLFFLFLFMGSTAEDFLCPNLVSVSKSLGLSQNIAGVTFLAFGNGAPDIFSSIAGIRQARAELVIGELFGGGIFVTTVVVGSILMTADFKIMQRPIVRDILFYGASCFVVWSIIYQQKIFLWQTICILCIYLGYIAVVIIGRIIYQRRKRTRLNEATVSPIKGISRRRSEIPGITTTGVPVISIITTDLDDFHERRTSPYGVHNLGFQADSQSDRLSIRSNEEPYSRRRKRTTSSASNISHASHRLRHHHQNYLHVITHSSDFNPSEPCNDLNCDFGRRNSSKIFPVPSLQSSCASDNVFYSRKDLMASDEDHISDGNNDAYLDTLSPIRDLVFRMTPFGWSEFKEMRIDSKVFAIFKFPFVILITLTTPIVDTENHRHNWCRLLNCFHCITAPLFLLYISGRFTSYVNGIFPVSVIILLVGVIISVIAFFTSCFERPPKYHAAFSVLGFVVAGSWTYLLASEVVLLLKAVGILINLSDVILGLTVLAWGNSLGDFISNLSMARQGFPKMGISACFGGPLLSESLMFYTQSN